MSRLFPWYDSVWLHEYVTAKRLIEQHRPAMLPDFVHALEKFKTSPDFQVRLVDRVFDEETTAKIKEAIRSLQALRLELHETKTFGRFIVHDDPYFTELQKTTTALVSEAAGEEVEPCYNFLSLYTKLGICPIHLDAPSAKWTLDICVDQTEPWPIHFSQIVPWPEPNQYPREGWQEAIKNSPALRFETHLLRPGQALVFSGSSQWHYRDSLAQAGPNHFCTLLFFHFVPKGMLEISNTKNWARIFDLPELAEIIIDDWKNQPSVKN